MGFWHDEKNAAFRRLQLRNPMDPSLNLPALTAPRAFTPKRVCSSGGSACLPVVPSPGTYMSLPSSGLTYCAVLCLAVQLFCASLLVGLSSVEPPFPPTLIYYEHSGFSSLGSLSSPPRSLRLACRRRLALPACIDDLLSCGRVQLDTLRVIGYVEYIYNQ